MLHTCSVYMYIKGTSHMSVTWIHNTSTFAYTLFVWYTEDKQAPRGSHVNNSILVTSAHDVSWPVALCLSSHWICLVHSLCSFYSTRWFFFIVAFQFYICGQMLQPRPVAFSLTACSLCSHRQPPNPNSQDSQPRLQRQARSLLQPDTVQWNIATTKAHILQVRE